MFKKTPMQPQSMSKPTNPVSQKTKKLQEAEANQEQKDLYNFLNHPPKCEEVEKQSDLTAQVRYPRGGLTPIGE